MNTRLSLSLTLSFRSLSLTPKVFDLNRHRMLPPTLPSARSQAVFLIPATRSRDALLLLALRSLAGLPLLWANGSSRVTSMASTEQHVMRLFRYWTSTRMFWPLFSHHNLSLSSTFPPQQYTRNRCGLYYHHWTHGLINTSGSSASLPI